MEPEATEIAQPRLWMAASQMWPSFIFSATRTSSPQTGFSPWFSTSGSVSAFLPRGLRK